MFSSYDKHSVSKKQGRNSCTCFSSKKKKKGSYLPASTAIEQLESSVDGHWLWGPLTLYHNERPGLNEFSL